MPEIQTTNVPETVAAFPPYAESLLLSLARTAQRQTRAQPLNGQPVEPAMQGAIQAIQERLGPTYPDLSPEQKVIVAAQFAEKVHSLDTAHDRYLHTPDHTHEHGHPHTCSTETHGPIKRRLEGLERWTHDIKNQRSRLIAATALRGASLLFCPGDDIAAIGLQLYGAFAGQANHTAEHSHQEVKAILPRRPRIDFATNTAIISLPVDAYVPPEELPLTPQAAIIREHIV